MTRIAIIIPTYNESDNIVNLISEILKHTKKTDLVVIVDDNSPDKTADLTKKAFAKQKNVIVIKRTVKDGRGSAVFEGFAYAAKFKPKYYLEMDADFSHKPSDIPALAAKAEQGKNDIIIGSRYAKGSKIFNWSLKRKVFSKLANFYTKIILGVKITDYTNGYRIYSQRAMNFLLNEDFKTKGYILLSETAYKLHKNGFRFGEIPIIFVNRKRGNSNLNPAEIKEAFWGIVKIKFFRDPDTFVEEKIRKHM